MSTYIGINTTPRRLDVAPELRRTLEMNGMQARIARTEEGGYQLITYCHDTQTPRYYNLNEKQLSALVNGGADSQIKKAYQTFVNIVKDDYYVPKAWVYAKNANSPVVTGLHGYRMRAGDYGIGSPRGFRGFFGPRFGMFDGSFWHHDHCAPRLRRIGGQLFYDDRSFFVSERPDGRLNPGEMQSGAYGFYTKQKSGNDTLDNMKVEVKKPVPLQMSDEDKKKVRLISDISWYNTKGKDFGRDFNAMLAEHGIVLDKDKKLLTIKAKGSLKDMTFAIKDEQMKVLFNDSLKCEMKDKKTKKSVLHNPEGATVAERLAALNEVVKGTYEDKITTEKLKQKDYISLKLNPEMEKKVNGTINDAVRYSQANDIIDLKNAREDYRTGFIDRWNSIGVVDGRSLDSNRGFYLPGSHGRAVSVGEIQAYPSNDGGDRGTTFKMTAVINEKVFTHDISKEDYVKFLNYDDEHRLELFDKTFKEVSIKSARNGGLQDNFHSGRVDEAQGVAKLDKSYSFLTKDGEASTITSAMAWKDEVSGDYKMNVRDGKDAGMWSFKISEDQYLAFKSGDDDKKAALIQSIFPWREDFKNNVKVVPTSEVEQRFKEGPRNVLNDLRKNGLDYKIVEGHPIQPQHVAGQTVLLHGEPHKEPKTLEMSAAERMDVKLFRDVNWYEGRTFNNGQLFADMISTHGLVIDKDNKTLTVKAKGAESSMVYKLSDKDMSILLNPKIRAEATVLGKDFKFNEKEGNSISERLSLINDIIKDDFDDKVTKQMLNDRDYVSLKMKDASASYQVKASVNEKTVDKVTGAVVRERNENYDLDDIRAQVKKNLCGDASVNGESLDNLKESKMWRRGGENGRETSVGDIVVETMKDANGRPVEGKYKMSAVIDGNVISHEISQKEYNKFLIVDNYQRMKLFDKIFPEVKMATKEGYGTNVGAAILAAVTAVAGVAHAMAMPRHDHSRPDLYASVYSKPGVVSPGAVAAGLYESKVNAEAGQGLGQGQGRGM